MIEHIFTIAIFQYAEFVIGAMRTWFTITALFAGVGLAITSYIKMRFPDEF